MRPELIRALIIDDEAMSADLLDYLLRKHLPEIGLIKKATSASSGLELIRSFKPHLLFLDIQMPFMDGFELLKELPDHEFSVIFTTAYNKYAIKAIRFSALDYLLKPVDKEELVAAVKRFLQQQKEEIKYKELYRNFINNLNEKDTGGYRLALQSQEGLQLILPSEIYYCAAHNNYTRFFMRDGKIVLISKTIKEYEETLAGHDFIRVHKSYIVNLRYVKAFINQNDTVLLENNTSIPVSRRRKHDVLELLKSG